ncbi:uncharacterized protein ATNIH1004_004560 [Aspergillus tanneri]|uniref:Major facilitator superfamily (MFS) profile domain-containing protein n=1 Tax=Aspergillus tanneri TaxID=1220188 RepID=A0A5M9MNT1_9EURO|nr:uncharacterized protein ATNIH1004_004560 [Aspergillus tanneri]KAA8648675.1 hypothetical protein ATNIH1004_004560 [Aspergillus tanneri]
MDNKIKQAVPGASPQADAGIEPRSIMSNPDADNISAVDTDNPFRHIAPEELDKMVDDFVGYHQGLEEYTELLRCGARLAKDKTGALHYVARSLNLTEAQKMHIIHEKSEGLWEQSKYVRACILVTFLAGIIHGKYLLTCVPGMDPIRDPMRTTGDQWLFGVITSISFLAGGLLAPFFADPLQEYLLGRRGTIAIFCLVNIAGTIGQAFSANLLQLGICRAITGLSLAGKASSAPLLLAEAAPNHIRGRLLAIWQLSDALGIFFGAASNLAVLHIAVPETIVWRVNISTVLIPTIILLFLVYFVPESPRLLMKEGRYLPALESFVLYRPGPAQQLLAARDFIYAHFQLQMECTPTQAGLNLVALALCFLLVPETRGRTLEELRTIFDIPTKRHIQYRLSVVLPWLVERYLIMWPRGIRVWGRKDEKQNGSVYNTGLVTFHDWHMIDMDFQRLKKEKLKRERLERERLEREQLIRAQRASELRELQAKLDNLNLPAASLRSPNDYSKRPATR